MQNGTLTREREAVVYLRHEDDTKLFSLVERMPIPQKIQLEELVRNEGYTLLRALEKIGVLIAG
ncbi:MAG: hypothetical protein WC767_02285 [Candidatus Paceibacterota bacterium]|jgi:hypothetical protein